MTRMLCPVATVALLISVTASQARAAGPDILNLRRTLVVDVVQRTKDAVVFISTTKLISNRIGPFSSPFFQQFGGMDEPRVPVGSLGSGFIVHPDGYVVTNYHVVDRAREITVELLDGSKMPAELISSDPEADLAIVKIKTSKPLPTLTLGDSEDLMIGEPAIAIGNPLGFSHTVSTGIVSALHRDLKNDSGDVQLADLIQTDAAINPGNSGGPLLNAYGQVIGIDTAIRGDAQNIGFAIAVNRLRDLVPELMSPTQVTKLDLGVKLHELRSIEPPATITATISADGHDGHVGTIAGQTPHDIIDAYAILLRQKSGKTFEITFDSGPALSITPKAVPLPDEIVQAREKLGLSLEQLTPMSAQKYGLDEDEGLLVTEVSKESISGRAGLRGGDVIVQVGRYHVTNLNDFSSVLADFEKRGEPGGQLRVAVRRGGQIGVGILHFDRS